jgi:hypothetical protein
MPYGVVLLPGRSDADALIALSHTVGHGAAPINLLGDHAPPHVSVLHLDVDDAKAEEITAYAGTCLPRLIVKPIGLLFTTVPRGDYYVPQGGTYFGVEIVRRPDLNALHQDFLAFAAERGMRPLGAVGDDFRPHVTLGMTASPPGLPPLGTVPLGEIEMTLACGFIGPYGTFPDLKPGPQSGLSHTSGS